MSSRLAADAVLFLHLLFILFAVFGGLLLLQKPRLVWLHLPTLAWGVWIEASHGICPLTPLENRLRVAAGQAGYDSGFVEHYLLPLIYPKALTPADQHGIAIGLALWSILVYGLVIHRWRH